MDASLLSVMLTGGLYLLILVLTSVVDFFNCGRSTNEQHDR